MPRRKVSRAPSRAKPRLPDDSFQEVDMEREEKMVKMKLLLDDFDAEAEKRVAQMEEEIKTIQQSIKQIYKMELMRIPSATRSMLWCDFIKQENAAETSSKKTRQSIDQLLGNADELLMAAKKKGGRPRKNAAKAPQETPLKEEIPPQTATRTGRSSRAGGVLTIKDDNVYCPPSTIKGKKPTKKDVPATPINKGIPANNSQVMITPKFDTRKPLPPHTVKRMPKLGEIAISLTGSPLQTGPKEWLENIEPDEMDAKTREELLAFRERVNNLLKK